MCYCCVHALDVKRALVLPRILSTSNAAIPFAFVPVAPQINRPSTSDDDDLLLDDIDMPVSFPHRLQISFSFDLPITLFCGLCFDADGDGSVARFALAATATAAGGACTRAE